MLGFGLALISFMINLLKKMTCISFVAMVLSLEAVAMDIEFILDCSKEFSPPLVTNAYNLCLLVYILTPLLLKLLDSLLRSF